MIKSWIAKDACQEPGLELYVFGMAVDQLRAGPIESRLREFVAAADHSEWLDGPEFNRLGALPRKADYLFGKRRMIAEIKSINADPKHGHERRLKERFSQPDAPRGYGQVGLGAVFRTMPDGSDLSKMMFDIAGRVVRRQLEDANEQIRATRNELGLQQSRGLAILLNDQQERVDAQGIGFAIRAALERRKHGLPEVTYVWASVECHRIRLPDGRLAYPQLLVLRANQRPSDVQFLCSMILAWAEFNGADLHRVDHHGEWDCLRPVYNSAPPIVELY